MGVSEHIESLFSSRKRETEMCKRAHHSCSSIYSGLSRQLRRTDYAVTFAAKRRETFSGLTGDLYDIMTIP